VKLTDLAPLVDQYRAGLEAEMTLLHRLETLAAEQREASEEADYARINRLGDERDAVMSSLVTIEHGLKPIRLVLAEARDQLADVVEFQEVTALHRTAAELVAAILTSDQHSRGALQRAEIARRFAARTIEQGESTLAAYRRVVAPSSGSAALMNRKG
jgi:hypothetical protein